MTAISKIAKEINSYKENIILIYALNATGKTRLSVNYKDYTKSINNGKHAGVYYNAYSEDLFIWDNDEDNDNKDLKLEILPSKLNQFHSFLIEDDDKIREKLKPFFPKYNFQLNQFNDVENGIESITFFVDNDENQAPIKISRGEERMFVWCFFLALFEVDGWADEQNAHILIDDPVSSLDDHNIFITARSILKLIENNYLDKEKIIISTHHIGLFSTLATWLNNDVKKGGMKNLTKKIILKNDNGELKIKGTTSDVFLYHLHLLKTLEEAKSEQLFKYHIVLLRQVLENITSFIGSRRIGRILEDIGVTDVNQKVDEINALSHKQAYQYQFNEMNQAEEDLFYDVFEKLKSKYNFKF